MQPRKGALMHVQILHLQAFEKIKQFKCNTNLFTVDLHSSSKTLKEKCTDLCLIRLELDFSLSNLQEVNPQQTQQVPGENLLRYFYTVNSNE